MGLRAYFLLKVKSETGRDDLRNGVLELEEIPDVDYVEPVAGAFDLVVMTETPSSLEEITAKIAGLPWVDNFTTLRVVDLFDRQTPYPGEGA
ncbi:MAG TPA: hypothetical protein GXZ26_00965 [Firmicutes bacterium]|jgi:hypothetical protein|nr:hypothetical protein [Bacillota bacterium]